MKNFKLFTFFIAIITLTGSIYTCNESNSSKNSLTAYLYASLCQPQETIPAACNASKKVIIFDLDGVLCKTNDLQAFYEIGMNVIMQYMLQHGKPSSKKLFDALKDAPAVTKASSYNEGMRMPQIMVDWQCNAQELRDIQDEMINHILHSDMTIVEKNLMVNTVLMMTKPEKFIATRQIIPDGLELARTLKKLGYRLYILSNWDPSSFSLLKTEFPELFNVEGQDLFDGIMTSGKTGMIKPNSDIFEACLAKFKINRNQAIFIDDTIENVQAAQNLGISSIHCQNKNIRNTTSQLIEILHS
jgi:FMN phosphatase YigB (HAD superfamily)